jgi:hypothetical protein
MASVFGDGDGQWIARGVAVKAEIWRERWAQRREVRFLLRPRRVSSYGANAAPSRGERMVAMRVRLMGLVGLVVVGFGAGCTDEGGTGDVTGADGASRADAVADGGDTGSADDGVTPGPDGAVGEDVAPIADTTGGEDVGGGGECAPGAWSCDGLGARRQCNAEGDGFLPSEACAEGASCTFGQCGVRCPNNPKFGAYVGCEFWATDLPNYPDPTLNPTPENLPWAIVISNPGEFAVTVGFEMPPSFTWSPPDPVVAPGTAAVFELPNINVKGTSLGQHGVHIVASGPVTAHQFNPWDPRYSNDATLLLPDPLLGTDHVVLTWASSPLDLVTIPGLPTPENQNGYFTVIAAYDDTRVTFQTSGRVRASGPITEMAPGQLRSLTLNRGEVLSVQADPESLFEKADMSGSRVSANKPIAVFAGHEQAVIGDPPPADPLDPEADNRLCCADHLESQMWPTTLLGNRYFAIKSPPRGTTVVEPDFWRVQAADVGVTLTTNPPISGLNGVSLVQKGSFAEAKTPEAFEVTADGPIQVAQYLVSQAATEAFIGDPSMVVLVPVERFRKDYAFMLPDGDYASRWAALVRPNGATVTLDDAEVVATWRPIGTTGWEFTWVALGAGVHVASGSERFGLTLYGYSRAVSFSFVGGMAGPGE